MSGIVTISEEGYGTVKKVTFAWTSAANGAADATTENAYSGEVRRLVTVPGAGNNAPTTLYDVVVNDEDGTNILMGSGANRSATAVEQVNAASLGIVASDKLTLSVTAAGNAKQGTVHVYIR